MVKGTSQETSSNADGNYEISVPDNNAVLVFSFVGYEKLEVSGGNFIYKYFDKQAIDNDAKGNLNYTIYRYADVLLMYAEASNRAEGGQMHKP